MTSYSVVHFFEDNSVEAVPSFWINKDGTYCAWPKNINQASKLIERKSIPNECEFDYFKSRILKSNIASLLQARKMAEKATIHTDVSDDDYDNKSKRKLKSKKSNNFYSDCPDFSEFADNDISNINVYQPKIPGWSPSPKKSKTFNQSVSKTAYIGSSKNTLIVKKLCYEELQPITNHEEKNTIVVINNPDENEDGDAAINTPARCLEKSTKMITPKNTLISTPKPLSNTTVLTTTPISLSKPTEIQIGDNCSSQLNYIKTSECPKMSEVFTSTPTGLTGTFVSNNFQKEVLHTLTFIKHELRRVVNNQIELGQRLEILETRSDTNVHNDNSSKPFSLLNDMADCAIPLNNEIDLNIFEDKISGDNIFRSNLVNELSYIGGKHVKAMVKRMMYKLFNDELLKNYSFTGKKGKKKFSTLAICSVIFDTLKQHKKFKFVSQNEIEEIIKYILAQAPFNLKRLDAKIIKD
eukprot:XP_016661396.1 PREDICTED: uncharacterized protein LOC107884237 [Acyrthosiphon pisum]